MDCILDFCNRRRNDSDQARTQLKTGGTFEKLFGGSSTNHINTTMLDIFLSI
ncbi:unnamed protein product, partial [Acanthoscelides obtectus]